MNMRSKDALYLLPGTMCDKRLWAGLKAHLATQFDLHHVAIEQERDAVKMRHRIKQEITEKSCLLGFSMGGYLALEFALKNPALVRCLILVCASAEGLNQEEFSLRQKYIHWLKENQYNGMSKQRLSQFVHPDRVNESALTDVIRDMDQELGKDTLICQLDDMSHRTSLMGRLSEIQFPVLLIGAEQDNFVSYEHLREVQRCIPCCQLQMFEHCGHMLPLEQPHLLSQSIEAFCTSSTVGNIS